MERGGDRLYLNYPEMAYDRATQQIILMLLAYSQNTDYRVQPGWFWTGTNWISQYGTQPGGDNGVLVYDVAIQPVIELTFHLPHDTDIFEDKLWQWNGQAWKLLEDWS
ncbi:MAG TPA: hypothetical protein VKV20_20010 [Ktedonobacteraceae bacterium]|jgi:hypothetical protein|nr:hypothetical protein [Ktedonobacteraceae bacterium]